MTQSSRSRTRVLLTSAAALLLAGCSSTEEGTASPAATPAGSSGSAPTSTSEAPEEQDLAAGLLPAEAFAADAVVAPLSEAELAAGAALGADLEGLTITPEACAQAVRESQPGVEDLDSFAAQSATSGTSVVVQLLSTGGPDEDPVGGLAEAVATCPEATISSPEIGTATITFATVDVPDLGDGAAALSYTTSVAAPDGSQISFPALVGVVVDGDRLLTLVSTSLGGTVDPASFAALLQQAYDVQSAALD